MASISFQAPEAKARLEAAHAALRQQEEELTRLRELVKERESEFMAAIVKDGAVATTATAAAVALNPATATKLGAAGLGAAKGVQVAALGWKSHLIAGGVARGVAVGTLFPVDSVKTKMQVGKPVSFKISEIGHEHFKGFRAAILGQIPYGMLVFGTYETLKAKIFARKHDAPKIPVYVGCAMAGDVVGSVWLTPSEIIKQRLQSGVDRDAVSAARAIYAQRGLGGFYAGFSGLVARDLPYRALQLPLYEVAREAYTARYCAPLGRGVLPHEAMLVGATVGMAAAAVTTPLDVVKSRMMVGAAGSAGVGAVVRQVVAEGGPAALFTGVNQRVAYLGLSNAIFFIMYEFVRGIMIEAPTIQIGG